MKVLLYGVIPERNFGGPSLMHGAREIIKTINRDAEIIFYQRGAPVDVAVKDMDFKVMQIPYAKIGPLLIDAVKLKFGIKPLKEERRLFFDHVLGSDIIASLLGICFCANFPLKKKGYINAVKYSLGAFPLNFIAKLNGIKSVKCSASYGPIKPKIYISAAKFATKHVFDLMFAREVNSRDELEKATGLRVAVTPDLANLMPYHAGDKKKIIGISVSHQIIKQWRSPERYVDCVVNLIKRILTNTDYSITLIPNEVQLDSDYQDTHVAEEIHNMLGHDPKIEIINAAVMTSTQLKNHIAECEVLIASRYHSCVAALSSGVPVLVIGWHYKYDELLKWYGQSEWGITSQDCTSEKLNNLFDRFWAAKEENKTIIKSNYPKVRDALLEAGREMFSA